MLSCSKCDRGLDLMFDLWWIVLLLLKCTKHVTCKHQDSFLIKLAESYSIQSKIFIFLEICWNLNLISSCPIPKPNSDLRHYFFHFWSLVQTLGRGPDCWVSVEFLHAPIPRKGSGSTTTTNSNHAFMVFINQFQIMLFFLVGLSVLKNQTKP